MLVSVGGVDKLGVSDALGIAPQPVYSLKWRTRAFIFLS